MEIKIGDIYIRRSDGQICKVKWASRTTVVLESEDGRHLRMSDIFALGKAYSKRESEPAQKPPARLP